MDPRLPSLVALNGRISPSLSSFILSGRLEGSHDRDVWTVRGLALGSAVNPTALFKDTSDASPPAPHRLRSRGALDHVGFHASRSMRTSPPRPVCRSRKERRAVKQVVRFQHPAGPHD